MTTMDGFVSTCLDIRDGMMFYDRELLLTSYSSTLELLLVSTLFWAGLESSDEAEEAEARMGEALSGLRKELSESLLPLDVQALGERYLNGPGWALEQRFPMYIELFQVYRSGAYDPNDDVDRLLITVQKQFLQGLWEEGLHTLAQVGSQVMRGAHLRPIWFRIGHARLQLYLAGIQTMANNFSVAPYFSFPFEDAATERQKRSTVGGSVVVDLGAFRNDRSDKGSFTDRRIVIEPDQLDRWLDQLVDPAVTVEKVADGLSPYRDKVAPILGEAARSSADGEAADSTVGARALQILALWGSREGAEAALNVLAEADPWDSVFEEGLRCLRSLGHKAVPSIRRYLRGQRQDGPLMAVLADTLSKGRPSKRVAGLLREIFDSTHWGHGREVAAMALTRMGTGEDIQNIRHAMEKAPRDASPYMQSLQETLANMEGRVDGSGDYS